jgi:hypothetical protein
VTGSQRRNSSPPPAHLDDRSMREAMLTLVTMLASLSMMV